MKANVFHGKNNIRVEDVEKPRPGVGALSLLTISNRLTTCLASGWTA